MLLHELPRKVFKVQLAAIVVISFLSLLPWNQYCSISYLPWVDSVVFVRHLLAEFNIELQLRDFLF